MPMGHGIGIAVNYSTQLVEIIQIKYNLSPSSCSRMALAARICVAEEMVFFKRCSIKELANLNTRL